MTTARARRATAPEEDSGHRDGPRDGHRHAPQDGPRDRPRRRRRRIRFSRSTAKEAAYLLLDLPMGVAGFVYVVTVLSLGIGLAVTVVGLPLLAAGLAGCRALGRVERARARALLGLRVEERRLLRRRPAAGFLNWVWRSLRDAAAWRHALYFLVRLPWGIFTFVVVVVLLVAGWPLLPWAVRGLADVDRMMARALLALSDDLQERIAELESGRGTVADTAQADLRRIERDLHDGAQARLVALAMELGLAREKFAEDPQAAARMVEEAHSEVKTALQELRDLARGIHPAVLTDRGLSAALSAIAARCTVPVTVTVDLPSRPAPAIEGIAYFTATELLTNISKHGATATRALVDIWHAEDRILLQVVDDGQGGAHAAPGSGLAGLAERIGAVDGLLLIDSPRGGPTRITAELPWR